MVFSSIPKYVIVPFSFFGPPYFEEARGSLHFRTTSCRQSIRESLKDLSWHQILTGQIFFVTLLLPLSVFVPFPVLFFLRLSALDFRFWNRFLCLCSQARKHVTRMQRGTRPNKQEESRNTPQE